MRWVLAEFSNSIITAGIMKELSRDFLKPFLYIPSRVLGGENPARMCEPQCLWHSRALYLTIAHTLLSAIISKFLCKFTDIYVVKWNLAQGNMLNCFASFQVPVSLLILCEFFSLRPQHSEGFDRIH